MSGRLEGQVAIITGGTSGIGEGTSQCFVEEGARVVIAGRSEDKGQAIASRLGKQATQPAKLGSATVCATLRFPPQISKQAIRRSRL